MAPHPVISRATTARPARRSGWRTAVSGIAAMALLLGGALVAAPAAGAATARPAAVDPAVAAPMPATTRLYSFDSQMLSLINGARASAGVPRLALSGGLTSLAVWWSGKMASGATGYQLQHNPNAWNMLPSYGASNRTAWAENVAGFSNGASAQAVFNAYMNSPGHRANILSRTYHYVGVGTVAGSKATFNTMEFTDKVNATTTAPKTTTTAPKPAVTTAPKPAAKPKPATTTKTVAAPTVKAKPSVKSGAKPAPNQLNYVASQPARPAAAKPARGLLIVSFGKLGVPGVTFAIRDAGCHRTVATATTARDGRAVITARPGSYCAVVTAAPAGLKLPKPRAFTVQTGRSFTVALSHLVTVTVWWQARGASLPLPV